jgi:predicted CXXCH cytochrome family protein
MQGVTRGLWSHKLSVVGAYTLYSGTTTNTPTQPVLGSSSTLCLSCHDGTVAPGQTVPYGKINMIGSMLSQDVFGTDLSAVHPFNFNLKSGSLQCTTNMFVCNGVPPSNPAVRLFKGNVQCATCHDPHAQSRDPQGNFLVMDNTNSGLCLSCHTSSPVDQPMAARSPKPALGSTQPLPTVKKYTPFGEWNKSAHAVSSNRAAKTAMIGHYGTTRQNACLSCHRPHNAPGAQSLLSGPSPAVANMDTTTQACINCHNGSSNQAPVLPNVYAEFAKTSGHPFPTGKNTHDPNESLVLNNNRHATCVDCHDPHATQPTGSFALMTIRPSQNGTSGVSVTDGVTAVTPAVNQYETCLRCHGSSTGKQSLPVYGYLPVRQVTTGDPLNLIQQFNNNTRSSHPVMHDRSSSLPQPSLLSSMLKLDGRTPARPMGVRMLCTDCHNSDDNREFGGTGPNGPHGSQYAHILERRYDSSQVAQGAPPLAGPGSAIQNILPLVVDPAANGPYSLCAKCHDLTKIACRTSLRYDHLKAGFSCSVCHSAHGVSQVAGGSGGTRLINFDLGVVAPVGTAPIAYNPATNSCNLRCHNYTHGAVGAAITAPIVGAPTSVRH